MNTKGPQGAIYGRNAAAGAVVLSTLKPSDEYTGKLKVGLGEHGTQTASGYLSGPLEQTLVLWFHLIEQKLMDFTPIGS